MNDTVVEEAEEIVLLVGQVNNRTEYRVEQSTQTPCKHRGHGPWHMHIT